MTVTIGLISPTDPFNRAQYRGDTSLNRYAATNLDLSYHESAQFWGRVVQIAALIALSILGTIGSVYFQLNDAPLAGVVSIAFSASMGVNVYQWCDDWIIKQARYAQTARIYNQIVQEHPEYDEGVRRLMAHQSYYTQALENEEIHSMSQLEQLAGEAGRENLSNGERYGRIKELYNSAANACVWKIRAAYFTFMIEHAADTRELLDICIIQPWDFESYAVRTLIGEYVADFGHFVRFNNNRTALSMGQVLDSSIEQLAGLMRLQ